MTEQFHEGQEVEIAVPWNEFEGQWPRAKIVRRTWIGATRDCYRYVVQFADGRRATFDAAHIRADTTLRVSSNDPMGTRPMTKDEARDFKAELAQAHDEALQAEGKP